MELRQSALFLDQLAKFKQDLKMGFDLCGNVKSTANVDTQAFLADQVHYQNNDRGSKRADQNKTNSKSRFCSNL